MTVMFTTAFIFNKKKILSLEDKNQYTIKKNYVILGLDICIYVQGNIRVRHVHIAHASRWTGWVF